VYPRYTESTSQMLQFVSVFSGLSRRPLAALASLALILLSCSCGSDKPAPQQQGAIVQQQRKPPVLIKLYPPGTPAGQAFNRQPSGDAALAVEATNTTTNTVIVFGGQQLKTARASNESVSAIVPANLYKNRGKVGVYLKDGDLESNKVDFLVQ
jgi:hypothetical protein